MVTLENHAEGIQPSSSGSPLHQPNEEKISNVHSPSNEAKRQGDAELSQDGPVAKRVRTGDVDDRPFLINEDFELEEILAEDFFHPVNNIDHSSTEKLKASSKGRTESQTEVEYDDDDLVEILREDTKLGTFPSPVEAVKLDIDPTQPKNHSDEDDDVVIIDSPVASHEASSVHSQPVESIKPVQDVATSAQETLNYAMAKDTLGALADCTAIRFVLSQAPNIVHPHSWEKARDILTKVPPARDDYDIFKRLLFTWYTDRTDPMVEAEDENSGEEVAEEVEEAEEEAEPEEDLADKVFEPYVAVIKQLMEQVEKSKSEMRADKKFAAVNEDTQFLKKLADKLQDLWVRLLSSTDEKTLKFSRRVIAEELQEEIDQVLDHLEYKKQRDAEAEAEATATVATAAAIAEAANEQRVGASEPATDQSDMEISLINVDQEKDHEDGADSGGASGDDVDRQKKDSPADEALTPPSTASGSM